MRNIEQLSTRFAVRRLREEDVPILLSLCRSNPQYYRFCPPDPTPDSVRAELSALPPRTAPEDKHYLGFFDGEALVAVLDLITGYPVPELAFWGFFMVDAARQGRGLGSALVEELCAALAARGFRAVRLGRVEGNPQPERFWRKNGFVETGATWSTESYRVIVMQKRLT